MGHRQPYLSRWKAGQQQRLQQQRQTAKTAATGAATAPTRMETIDPFSPARSPPRKTRSCLLKTPFSLPTRSSLLKPRPFFPCQRPHETAPQPRHPRPQSPPASYSRTNGGSNSRGYHHIAFTCHANIPHLGRLPRADGSHRRQKPYELGGVVLCAEVDVHPASNRLLSSRVRPIESIEPIDWVSSRVGRRSGGEDSISLYSTPRYKFTSLMR